MHFTMSGTFDATILEKYGYIFYFSFGIGRHVHNFGKAYFESL